MRISVPKLCLSIFAVHYLYNMDKYEQSAQTWNSLARIYEEKFMHLDYYNESYDIFCELVDKEDAAILETGSGPGNICHYILQKHPGWKWLGTDVAPAMVELANNNNPAAHFEVMDARDIAKIDRSFDGIISGFCLPFLSQEDCSRFFKDSNLLMPGKGVLYLSFVEGNYEDSTLKTGSTGQSTYFHYHPMPVIEAQLQEAGFAISKVMHVQFKRNESDSETHTIVVAVKG